MKLKRKNRSVLFRGMVLATALAFSVLCFPVKEIVVSAEQLDENTDYTYMTIGTRKEEVSTTVTKGATYVIPKAYIGGDREFVVGGEVPEDPDFGSGVTLKSSKITVKYSSDVLGGVKDGVAVNSAEETDSDGFVTVSGDNQFSFTANKVGSYTVTYSYTYEIGGVSYTNNYDLTVTSEITDADISFEDNSKIILPSILDLSEAKKSDGSYKDMYIPLPELTDDDGNEIDTTAEDFEFITSSTSVGTTGKAKQLLIQVSASTNTTRVEVSGDAESGFYIAGTVFSDPNYGAGKYTVTYSYYENGEFIASTTKTSQVYSEQDSYYEDYALRLQLDSDFTDDGQTGVESTLPTASGLTSSSTDPASEAVDIYYTVTVYYKTSVSGKYQVIDATKYNQEAEERGEDPVVDEETGALIDPTRFTPLDDGYYSFVYEAYDYYYDDDAGKDASVNRDHYYKTDLGRYEFVNIKDERAPTPTVYVATKDGSLDDEDASSKIATRANPQSVIVYAIGIDDNVSKAGEDGVVLTRRIMTDETVAKLTLSSTDERDYSDYNLIFNYRGRDGLKNYNYLVRKQIEAEEVPVEDTEEATLAWLAENKYLIVVDNANYGTIYDLFKDENVFDGTVTDAATALTWFKSDAALEKGFAYVDCDQTFGASASTTGGMGVGQYYIHYIAKDAAGNETDITKRIYIREFEDVESPDITFSTSLADSYLPTSTISFDAPTASDNIDENMSMKVMYRYLNEEGEVVTVYDEDGSTPISTENLSDLWTDLGTDPDLDSVRDDNNTLITEKYSAYHSGDDDGYVDITSQNATSYTIDLSEVKGATKLQIVAYVYDDMGNPMLYGQTIDITNIQDNYPPQLLRVNSSESTFITEYDQGATIALPQVVVADDAVGYMTYDVKVDYIKDGERYTRTARESTADRQNQEGMGVFTVNAGEFVAANEGNYQVSIAVKDANNKTIVVFTNYTVSARAIVQEPTITSTFESQTVELDDKPVIEIPTPTVSFELGDSVTYDTYSADGYSGDATYVVRGLNADGKATNWTTTGAKVTNSTFTPDATGEYEIQYSVKLEAYNQNVFKYNEGGLHYDNESDTTTYTEAYYSRNDMEGIRVRIAENGDYQIEDADRYYVIRVVDGEAKLYNAVNSDYEIDAEIDPDSDLSSSDKLYQVDLAQWVKDLRYYNLKSDIYTITVTDTQGPSVANYNYSDQEFMTVEDFQANGITVYGIEATDASGIDWTKSQVVLSWKRANGTSAGDTGSTTYRGEDAAKDNTYKSSASNLNGTYTITYTVYDLKGNSTTATYTISVGDNEDPKITFPEDFIKTSYTLRDQLVIDLDPTKVIITDNNPMPEDATPRVKLVNTSTNEEVKYSVEGTKYIFDAFDSSDDYGVGSYTLTIEVEDAVGRVTTEEFTFDVTTETRDSTETYKIVGTVLIVVSVLVLAGVIIYFIVSKVKLDKELKK